jgi:hypothetical protein
LPRRRGIARTDLLGRDHRLRTNMSGDLVNTC